MAAGEIHDASRFAELLDTLDAVVWEADAASFAFTYVSNGAERILGYPAGQWLHDPGFWPALVHPEDRAETVAFCRRAVAQGRDHEFEYRAVTASGQVVWLHDVVHVVTNDAGEPELLRGVMVDITEKKLMEHELRASEERFRAQYNNLPFPAHTWKRAGEDFVLVESNETAYKQTEGRIREWEGRLLGEIYPHRADIIDDFRHCWHSRGAIERELTIDDPFTGEEVSQMVRYVFAPPDLIVVQTVDVTAQKRAAEERQRLQQELMQSQKMEAVGQLAGGIAHDFNNLLSAVLNYASFIFEESGDNTVREDASEIMRAAERGAALTKRLLMFSRRERPKLESLDLNEVVAGVEDLLRRTIGDHVVLTLDLEPGLPVVTADRMQMEQAIINLALNGRDAMPEGGTLVISTRSADGMVRLVVRDDGTGMSEDVLQHALEPFFTTKPQGKGTGLGLSMIYGIVTDAGGTLDIDSAEGQGTIVTITLPAGGIEQAEDPGGGVEVPRVPHVLLVEDEDGIRRVTARVLEQRGYAVVATSSATEALHAFEGLDHVDVLLTDVVMPGMSGIELARELRDRCPGLQVLFMSGYPREVVERAEELEGPLLEKPFNQRDLLEALERVLSHRS